MSIIDKIVSENYTEAEEEIKNKFAKILRIKLENFKAKIALREFPSLIEYVQNTRRIGRLNFVRIRVRKGKVQRRRKVSAIKGWTLRRGRLIRMRPSERLHRRLSARRAKIKRRAKRAQTRRHTMISNRRRKSLGLSYKPFGRR